MVADWSNGETSVAGEDDLIKVKIETAFAAPAGIRFQLEKRSAAIRIWNSSTKGTDLVPVAETPSTITFPSGVPSYVWVEWALAGPDDGQAILTLIMQDAVSGNEVARDSLVFHPFTSIVIVLGGRNQQPNSDPPAADYGIFFAGRDLYLEGYDVHMYDEDDVIANTTDTTGAAYQEVLYAVSKRGVTSVAIFGYSYGGGATYNLAAQIDQLRPTHTFTTAFTAYVDAIVPGSTGSSEDRRPLNTAWHLNIYQRNDFLFVGAPMPEDHPDPNHRANEDINTDEDAGFTRGLDHESTHTSIDNDNTVQTHLKEQFRQRVAK